MEVLAFWGELLLQIFITLQEPELMLLHLGITHQGLAVPLSLIIQLGHPVRHFRVVIRIMSIVSPLGCNSGEERFEEAQPCCLAFIVFIDN